MGSVDLRLASQAGSALGSLGLRWGNVVGSPVTSATDRQNGQAVADRYLLTFHVAGSVTVDVAPDEGSKNPYEATGLAVVADGATANPGIVPGFDLVVAAGVQDGDQAVVAYGVYLDGSLVATRVLNMGAVLSGRAADPVRLAVVNTGATALRDVSFRACPGLYFEGGVAETHIAQLRPHTSASRCQLASAADLALTFGNWTDQGGYYTADVYVGGQLCIATAKFDAATVYEHGAGNGYVDASDLLRGLAIVFAARTDTPVGSTVNVHVRDGWEWVTLADDESGSPGVYDSVVTLDEIAAGGTVELWWKWTLPATAQKGDLRLVTPRVEAEEV